MNRVSLLRSLFLVLTLTLLAGCGVGSGTKSTAPLNANNLNLIFVISPDLTFNGAGDINPNTANLTINQAG